MSGAISAGPGSVSEHGRLTGGRVLVVGAGTRDPGVSGDDDAPVGNGRAIAVLAAREGGERRVR